jgi:hypothetical protein
VAKIGLQGSGIDALIGERVAAGMPEHVGMDLEANIGLVTGRSPRAMRSGRDRPEPHVATMQIYTVRDQTARSPGGCPAPVGAMANVPT